MTFDRKAGQGEDHDQPPQRSAKDELERQVIHNINDFGWHAVNVIEDDDHPPWTFPSASTKPGDFPN